MKIGDSFSTKQGYTFTVHNIEAWDKVHIVFEDGTEKFCRKEHIKNGAVSKPEGTIKICSKCRNKKPITEYYKGCSQCKPCKLQTNKKYREANKESVNLSKRLEYKSNKKKYKARAKRWAQANKTRRTEICTKNALKRKQRVPSWLTRQDLEKIQEIYEEAKSKTQETGIKHHVDHIIPLNGEKVSGLHVPCNLRVIPEKDNLSKGNKYNV